MTISLQRPALLLGIVLLTPLGIMPGSAGAGSAGDNDSRHAEQYRHHYDDGRYQQHRYDGGQHRYDGGQHRYDGGSYRGKHKPHRHRVRAALDIAHQDAAGGDRDAQFLLGDRYARGVGVPQSWRRAYLYFSLAADQGHLPARFARDDVGRYLSNHQRYRIERRAQRLSAVYMTERDPFDDTAYRANTHTDISTINTVGISSNHENIDSGYQPPLATDENLELLVDIDAIALIQRSLYRLGYDAGPIDGKLGPLTLGAIRSYQRDHQLATSGRPSIELMEHLSARLYDPADGADRYSYVE